MRAANGRPDGKRPRTLVSRGMQRHVTHDQALAAIRATLEAAEGPVSIGRLSELLATDRTTLTRNLKPLLVDGLVERASSSDKRRHELVATPAGRALFKRALPLWAAAEQEVRAVLGGKLTADLHGALDRSMEKLATL